MRIYVDGFVFGAHPRHGGGYSVVREGFEPLRVVVSNEVGFTSNEAELRAILAGIELAQPGDKIVSDSQCALLWVKAGFCKARPDLTPLAKQAHDAVLAKRVAIYWSPRDINKAGLFNEGMLTAPKY